MRTVHFLFNVAARMAARHLGLSADEAGIEPLRLRSHAARRRPVPSALTLYGPAGQHLPVPSLDQQDGHEPLLMLPR